MVSTAHGITCPCDSPAMGDGGGEGPGLRVCSVLEYRQAGGPLSFLHKVRDQRLQQLTHSPGVTPLSHEAAFSSPGASTSRLSAVSLWGRRICSRAGPGLCLPSASQLMPPGSLPFPSARNWPRQGRCDTDHLELKQPLLLHSILPSFPFFMEIAPN